MFRADAVIAGCVPRDAAAEDKTDSSEDTGG
jgi:hypothetical protein